MHQSRLTVKITALYRELSLIVVRYDFCFTKRFTVIIFVEYKLFVSD